MDNLEQKEMKVMKLLRVASPAGDPVDSGNIKKLMKSNMESVCDGLEEAGAIKEDSWTRDHKIDAMVGGMSTKLAESMADLLRAMAVSVAPFMTEEELDNMIALDSYEKRQVAFTNFVMAHPQMEQSMGEAAQAYSDEHFKK